MYHPSANSRRILLNVLMFTSPDVNSYAESRGENFSNPAMMDSVIDKHLLEADWLSKFNIQRKDIFEKLLDYRNQDVHRLLAVLDECHRSIATANQRSQLASLSSSDILVFIHGVISVYCHCIESIKLSRAALKLMKPWEDSHKDIIKQYLDDYITRATGESSPPLHSLVVVSNLLEQNSTAFDIVEKHLTGLLSWLNGHLGHLVSGTEQELTKIESSRLYMFVKIVLQVFQSFQKQTSADILSLKRKEDEDVSAVYGILGYLFRILNTKCFAVDCTVLAGTAFAMFLYSAPVAEQVISRFWYIYRCLNLEDSPFSVLQLCSSTQDQQQQHLSQNSINYNIGTVALIKGLISCGTDAVLSAVSHVENDDHQQPFIFDLFPLLYQYCRGPLDFHYHSFTVLHLWYLRVLKLTPDIPVSGVLTSVECDVVKHTVQLVWLNWDSPIEDVAQLAASCLKCLLEVWDVLKKEQTSEEGLKGVVLAKLNSTPWYIKGKYRIFSIVLPYLQTAKMLKSHSNIQTDLLKCMSTSYLAPSAGDIYKSFLQEMRKTSDPDHIQHVWSDQWLEILQDGLLHSHLLTRSNVNHYWVSSTVKILPEAGILLQSHLAAILQKSNHTSPRQLVLHAYIAVSKMIRINIGTEIQSMELLREAMYSSEEDVRSEAIGLVCISLKKAEPLSVSEVTLLKEVIPHNLKIDSAPFRQQLSASLKKLLVRVRDSSIATLKFKQLEKLETSVEFIQWLYTLCIDNLAPGGCYQRRKTSLDILQILLQTFVYDEDAKQRKSFTPATAQKLEAYVKERDMWQFFTAKSASSLIRCVLDGADEIQELASHLLQKYPFFPLSSDDSHQGLSQEVTCHLLSEAMNLCNSPKSYESQSGALLCKVIFTECVLKRNWRFFVQLQNGVYQCDITKEIDTCTPSCVFLGLLMQQVSSAITASKHDIVTASRTYPIHGFISAASRCLTETHEIQTSETQMKSLLPLILNLVNVNMDIIDTMLGVMAKDTGTESCPSFAEIGEALESWISESQTDYSQSTSLSHDHQYLLSWCWVNIKESCLSLGSVSCLLLQNLSHDLDLTNHMRNISDTFCRVLTRCRHRGVIEGCRTAFIKFCSALFNSPDPTLSQQPRLILEESFVSLRHNAAKTSTTRKSAGLPVIIQSIVTSEKKLKKNTLLNVCLDKLFELSSLVLSADVDDRHDLPQVHGLNILKSLFGDASLSESLMPYISRAVVLVVDVFGSPAWAVRNAATRLFSSLITRIFGQRKSTDETSRNTLCLQELSSLYPSLPPYLIKRLDKALQTDIKSVNQLDPSLFPVLTLLASLGPVDDDQDSKYTPELRKKVFVLLATPVYFLRQLSSTAYTAFVPLSMVSQYACDLMSHIPDTGTTDVNLNFCHGVLLCMEKLLINHSHRFSSGSELIGRLLRRSWLCSGSQSCDHVISVYLNILRRAYKSDMLSASQVSQIIQHTSIICISKYGNSLSEISRVKLSFLINSSKEDLLLPVIESSMSSSLTVKMTCIDLLKNCVTEAKFSPSFCAKIQTILLQSLSSDSYPLFVASLLRLIVDIHMYCGSTVRSSMSVLQSYYKSSREIAEGQGCMSAALMDCAAVCVQHQIRENNVQIEDLVNLCSNIRKASEMTGGEDHRTAAARCLLVAGTDILKFCQSTKQRATSDCVVQLTVSCLNLVQDDETEIRDLAVQFVSTLEWPSKSVQYNSLQCNVCLELLSDYVSEHFYWSATIIQEISNLMYTPGEFRYKLVAKDTMNKQLFEVEDNSFFAEKVYIGVWLYNLLKKMINRACADVKIEEICDVIVHVQKLIQDIHIVKDTIDQRCAGNPVINILCYPSVFSIILRLLLSSKFAVQLCSQNGQNLHTDDVAMLKALSLELEQNLHISPLVKAVLKSGESIQ